MQTILKEYIRNEKNQPRGIVVATLEDGEVLYGYSLLNTDMDIFNKELGLTIALNRARTKEYLLPKLQDRRTKVLEGYSRLEARAVKYFKDIDPSLVRWEYAEIPFSRFTEK